MSPEHKYALPPGLHLRQYIIVRLLGHGGFGLTYLADDTKLNRKVAIKEFLPIDFAIREKDGTTVVARSQQDKSNLEWARQRFVEEGQTLAGLHHPSILPIHEIFDAHGTAYLVTAFIEGGNLENWLRDVQHPAEKDLRSIALCLLDALELVHQRGYLHRDVKPENILMDRQNLRPVLIDFGNARVATGERTSNLTAVLTKGYAPFEQYQTKGRQGPFTDLYALGAVLYRAIKGVAPEDATDRWEQDKVEPLCRRAPPGYSREFLASVDKALQMRREDRWQNCEAWKAALASSDPPRRESPGPSPQPSKIVPTMVALGVLTLACVGIGQWIHRHFPNFNASNKAGTPSFFTPTPSPFAHLLPNPFAPKPAPTPFDFKPSFLTPDIVFPTPASRFPALVFPPPTPFPSLVFPTPHAAVATPSATPLLRTLAFPTPHRRFALPSPTPQTPGFFFPPPDFGADTPSPTPRYHWLVFPTPSPTPRIGWLPPTGSPWPLIPKSTPAEYPFVNSLGMKFMPVETFGAALAGERVLFSVWDTRVSDWQAFVQNEGDTPQSGLFGFDEKELKWGFKTDLNWKHPGFAQTSQDPVVGVSWEDARRFCAWLSRKEGRTYRLPTSSEWSAAAGTDKYPWGNNFPPPEGAGNYAGSEFQLKLGAWTIFGYNDGFPRTSPAGSFPPNRHGLYDMGGNVWQWCEDEYKASMNTAEALGMYPFLKDEKVNGTSCRVIRGGAWGDFSEMYLRSSFHAPDLPASRRSDCGFRCVLVVSGS